VVVVIVTVVKARVVVWVIILVTCRGKVVAHQYSMGGSPTVMDLYALL